MREQDELPFSVTLSQRVSVEFALVKHGDGRYGRYGATYQTIKKFDKTIPFPLELSTFSNINEARRSIVDQAKKQIAAGLTGDLDDAIDVAL
jgi:hypothetical protein